MATVIEGTVSVPMNEEEYALSSEKPKSGALSSPLADEKVYRNAVKDRMAAERARQKTDALNKLERAYKEKTFLIDEVQNIKSDLLRARDENDMMRKEIAYKNSLVKKGSEMTSHAMQDLLSKYFAARQRECMLQLRRGYERSLETAFLKWLSVTIALRVKEDTTQVLTSRFQNSVNRAQRDAESAKMAEKAAWRVVSQIKRKEDGAAKPGERRSSRMSRGNSIDLNLVEGSKGRAASLSSGDDWEVQRSMFMSQARDMVAERGAGEIAPSSSSGRSEGGVASGTSNANRRSDAPGTASQKAIQIQGSREDVHPTMDMASFLASKTKTPPSKEKESGAVTPKAVSKAAPKAALFEEPKSPLHSLVEEALSELSQLDDDCASSISTDYTAAIAAIMGGGTSLQSNGEPAKPKPRYMKHTRVHFHGGQVLSAKALKRLSEKKAGRGPQSGSSVAGSVFASSMGSDDHTFSSSTGTPYAVRGARQSSPGSGIKQNTSPKKPRPKGMSKAQYELIYGVEQTYTRPVMHLMHDSPGIKWI